MDHATSIIGIASAAFLLPLVARRAGMPAVVLEILFGVLVGPSVLGWLHSTALLDFLAEFGFLLLMFLSGFEIDFGKLERKGPGLLLLGFAVFLGTLGLSYAAAEMLDRGAFATLLLATTSVGLVVPTLRTTQQSSTLLGQSILISALLADFLTLTGVTVFAVVVEYGIGWRLLHVPALLAIIGGLLLLLRRIAWWNPHWFERMFSSRDPEEMGIRTCLALMFVCVGLSSALGIEPILGAFLAGTIFALVFRNRGTLEEQLSGFSYGFLIPIFFIHVGMSFEIAAFREPGVLAAALALIAAALAVKLVPSVLFLLQGLRPREVLAAGVLLSARLSLVIAVARLGGRLGLLDRGTEASVILLAVVTATFCPTLFRALVPPRSDGVSLA